MNTYRPAGRPHVGATCPQRQAQPQVQAQTQAPAQPPESMHPQVGLPFTLPLVPYSGLHVMFGVKIDAYGDPRRDDEARKLMHMGLYEILNEAFDNSGVDVRDAYQLDRGDGALLFLLRRTDAIEQLVDPLIPEIHAGLRAHNRRLNEIAQLRLRAALDFGNVHFDRYGVVGASFLRFLNLLNINAFQMAVSALDTELGFVTTDHLYEEVIRHSPNRIDPTVYHPIKVRDGDRVHRVWMHFPPGLVPPAIEVPRMRTSTETDPIAEAAGAMK